MKLLYFGTICNAEHYMQLLDGFRAKQSVAPFVFESALASFTVTDGLIREVNLQPLSLGFKNGRSLRGRPELADAEYGEQILGDIADLSKEYGTEIRITDGKGKIVIG